MNCSLIFQLVSPDKVSYGLLPSRIWQFLIGTLCYEPKYEGYKHLKDQEALLEEKVVKKEKSWLFLGIIQCFKGIQIVVTKEKTFWLNYLSELSMMFVCLLVIANPSFFCQSQMRFVSSFLVLTKGSESLAL